MEIAIESVESSKLKRGAIGELAESIFRLSALVGTALDKPIKYFLGQEILRRLPLGSKPSLRILRLSTLSLFRFRRTRIRARSPNALGQDEIERRRNLVRMLFNDYWNGAYEKPAAFGERLDQAEDYLNERLAASGEIWQLDAKARIMLGLPPTKSIANFRRR
jgi:hypothetical protein